ncbi:WAS/WASL-interacting protein family member 3 [Cyclopterus lumpus]|uniref:WAS/WASL-interacting protein family member 3 n=1 Tax=Cyclopterus lumpus TaxID=8103 RepID=UPI00148606C2|nr:WAS/WASL-interacting protein family member 3 [Cyclopterus lumpus]
MLTTQSQNCYREQIQKEMLTRLAWKSRYAHRYPSCRDPPGDAGPEPTVLPRLPAPPTRAVLPPVSRTTQKQSAFPPPAPPPAPAPPPGPPPAPSPGPPPAPGLSLEGDGRLRVTPLMRPVSPQTRRALYQDSSHHGKGRRLYLQRRGHVRPEEKFDFPLLSSWEYGWRLGDYSLDYRTPSRAKSSVVKNTFYARNGVFSSPSATDALG